jgi:hypothetical protein
MKNFPENSLKSILLTIWIVTSALSLAKGQSLQEKNFSLPATSAITKVGFHKQIQKDGTEIPLAFSEPVSGLSLTADILLKSEAGYIRVILMDLKNNEFLVFETNTLLSSEKKFSINDFCEETRELSNIEPSTLRVELADAEILIKEINVTKSSSQKAMTLNKVARPDKAQVQDKIDQINAQIKKKGLLWRAGKTSVSEMSYIQKKALFSDKLPNLFGFEFYTGGIFSLPTDNSNGPAIPTIENSPYIPEFSWKNRNGQNWTTPAKYQNGCGSCWAFAATGATEQLVNLYYNRHLDLDLSEQQIVSCSNAGDCGGGLHNVALDYIKSSGIVNEACFPYIASNVPCELACTYPQEKIKIGGSTPWFVESDSKIYEDQMKAMVIRGPVSGLVGCWGHVMNLVGYKVLKAGDEFYDSEMLPIIIGADDPNIGKVAWLFKNSWGDWWGHQGYVYVMVDIINLTGSEALFGPVTSLTHTDADILCLDNDGDGYYTWGIGPKPAHCPPCPDEPDGDDSNPNLGPMDQYGYCRNLGPNHPPVANAGPDREFIKPLEPAMRLDGSGSSDPDYGPLNYSWVKIEGPACNIINATSAQPNITDVSQGIYKFELTVSDGQYLSKDTVTITVKMAENIALNKPVFASSTFSPLYDARYVNDGHENTEWLSNFQDSQFVQINLQQYYQIEKVILKWNGTNTNNYILQVSNDSIHWRYTYYYTTYIGDGSEYVHFDAHGVYLRIIGVNPNTDKGFALKEFEVYGIPATNKAPKAVACDDFEVLTPVNRFDLYAGGSSDADLDYLLFSYKQISGPSICTFTYDIMFWSGVMVTNTDFAAGKYVFELTVSDGLASSKDTVIVTLKQDINIALNKEVVVSSTQNSNFPGTNINDGDTNSQWSSAFSDPQWAQINLGRKYSINKVVLKWGVESANLFEIQVSNDGSHWCNASGDISGQGGTEIIDLYSTSAVYIRMYGFQRNTQYGYSLKEFEVYGIPHDNLPPVAEAGEDLMYFTPISWGPALIPHSFDPDNDCMFHSWKQISGPSCTINPPDSEGYVFVTNYTSGDYIFELTSSDGFLSDSDRFSVTIDNIAYLKSRQTSSYVDSSFDSKMNDGKSSTFWKSEPSDPQWAQIDLGQTTIFNSVTLKWGDNYAKSYKIETSNDASTWKQVYSTNSGAGGVEYLLANGNARYVRMYGNSRADSSVGYTLAEFEVFNLTGINLPPIAEAGIDQELYAPLESFYIYGYGSYDPENAPLSYSWKQIVGPACSITLGMYGMATVTSTNLTAGTYVFELTVSDGFLSSTDQVTVTVKTGINIALNKPVVVSSIENSNYSCSKVNDGDLKTRWSSAFSDPQYVQINLGRSYRINKVVLKWEAASAKKYQIQVSNNGNQWKTISSESNGDGGTDIINIDWPLNASYIRLYGETRNTPYGYSLFEFEVYGTPEDNLPPVVNIFLKDYSLLSPLTYFTIYYSTYDPNGNDLLANSWKQISGPSCTMSLGWNYGDYLSVTNFSAGDYVFELTASDGLLSASDRASVTIDNLAYIKPSLSSSNQGSSVSSNMNDGNTTTLWTSNASDPQWVQVDLQKNYLLKNVVLKWGTTYAKSYRIETSDDGTSWKQVYSTAIGKGGTEYLNLTGNGRYIRMYGLSRSSSNGYSLAEFEVFGIEDKAAPIGSIVTFKAVVNNKYVCADNYGNNPLIANRTTSSTWEQFKVSDAGNGYIALKALVNNKYVTAENYGNSSLIARASEAKTWESFKWVNNADGTVSLKALINGKYVAADNNGNNPLIAKSDAIGSCEKFNFNIVVASAPFGPTEIDPEAETATDIIVYPNPANSILYIDLGEINDMANISIFDIDGRLLNQRQTAQALNEVDVAGLKTSGLIIIKVTTANRTTILKAVIQN